MDLSAAQHAAFRQQLAAQFGHRVASHPRLKAAAEAFVHDPQDFYTAYITGQLSFAEHRLRRLSYALELLQLSQSPDEQLWLADYEPVVAEHLAPFDDVVPLLSALDELGVRYGAVTNNVTDYQAHKLASAGLDFDLVIGTDVTGKPKPHASMFLEAARRLQTDPGQTLMIGDDVVNDGLGARDAGLISLLVDRRADLEQPERVHKVRTLSDVLHKGLFRFDNTII